MQIEIYTPTQGEILQPIKWNFEELKEQLTEGLKRYEGVVYTAANIGEAKKDRAALNKLSQAIDGKRKEMKALYLAPYSEFEAQAKELTGMIDNCSKAIDAQVKEYEAAKKAEKQEKIKELYAEMIGDLADLVPYERLHVAKWLNVTTSLSSIASELEAKIDEIKSGLSAINGLDIDNDIVLQVKTEFLKGFNLAAALRLKDQLIEQRKKIAEYEAAQKAAREEKPADKGINQQEEKKPVQAEIRGDSGKQEEQLITIDFRVRATEMQLRALKRFLTENGIRYGKVN